MEISVVLTEAKFRLFLRTINDITFFYKQFHRTPSEIHSATTALHKSAWHIRQMKAITADSMQSYLRFIKIYCWMTETLLWTTFPQSQHNTAMAESLCLFLFHYVYGHQDMDWLCDAPFVLHNTSASVTVTVTSQWQVQCLNYDTTMPHLVPFGNLFVKSLWQ